MAPELPDGWTVERLRRHSGDAEAGEWYMGHLDPDGSVGCWASYGPDLAEAIRNL
ncbi:hypothetical protein ABZ079_24965 [Streptomyces sp. NPDC006314]|uniref:hypothetical protein n=1 Tax=Streptomyces sp. NPDC006314 TaxID=3154475 RepID=UPI0033A700D5